MKKLILVMVLVGLCASTTWLGAMPMTQVAKLVDHIYQYNAVFTLGSTEGGTYKFQFEEVQNGVWASYQVMFLQDGNFYYAQTFYSTSAQCDGAATVSLTGGHTYTMRIDYATEQGGSGSGLVAKATIFYTCNPQ